MESSRCARSILLTWYLDEVRVVQDCAQAFDQVPVGALKARPRAGMRVGGPIRGRS